MNADHPGSNRSGLVCLADFRPPGARSQFDVWKRLVEGLVSIDSEWIIDVGRGVGGEFIKVWAPRHAAAVIWAQTEAQLRIALGEVEVADTSRALVAEFLDHNELGLAFESLTEAVAAAGANASSAARQALTSAATLMTQEVIPGGDRAAETDAPGSSGG
jgi:hypothetical protein